MSFSHSYGWILNLIELRLPCNSYDGFVRFARPRRNGEANMHLLGKWADLRRVP
jgi:hypothetical protein